MDSRSYQSATVAAWCDRFHVCPDGRDLAAPCADLRTVWYKIDRPGWLLWMYAMEFLDDPSRWDESLVLLLKDAPLPPDVPHGDDLPIGWFNFTDIDAAACDRIRLAIPCLFLESSIIPPCRGVDGPVVVDPAKPQEPRTAKPEAPSQAPVHVNIEADKAGNVRGVTVGGRAFVPLDEARDTIDQQRDIIEAHRDDAHFWWRMARWTMYGAMAGIAVAGMLVFLVRREDAEQ